jgi:predicted ester cyclase
VSVEQNKEIVRAAFAGLEEVVASHRQLYSPEWVGHFPGMPPLDVEGHKQYSVVMNAAFPGLERTLEDLVAEGDKVVVRWSARGTHSGDFNGIPPTGKVASSSGITIFRVADGQIVEEWSESDMLGLLQQVGAIPSPG